MYMIYIYIHTLRANNNPGLLLQFPESRRSPGCRAEPPTRADPSPSSGPQGAQKLSQRDSFHICKLPCLKYVIIRNNRIITYYYVFRNKWGSPSRFINQPRSLRQRLCYSSAVHSFAPATCGWRPVRAATCTPLAFAAAA